MTVVPLPFAQLLTPAEAAARLGTTVIGLERARANGRGPAYVTIGRVIRYRPDRVQEYIDAGERTDRLSIAELATLLNIELAALHAIVRDRAFIRGTGAGNKRTYAAADVLKFLAGPTTRPKGTMQHTRPAAQDI